MPWFDLPLDQLRDYRTGTAEPPDPDLWGRRRLDEARATVRPAVLTRYETEIYAPVEVFDTEFSGADGDRIRAWYLRPPGADAQTQVVVKFIGYGGGRGMPAEHALLPALGYAVFVMDTRGQGGRWTTGATGDRQGDPAAGPENARVMTRGIAPPAGLLLHPAVHRCRAGGRDGQRADRRAAGGRERRQPGWRARAGRRRA